jgi:hypothetical protein
VALVNITQIVQVRIEGAIRRYTYGWTYDAVTGRPLKVGDKVEIPPNQVQEEGSAATVVALGSDYKGPVKSIVRVIDGPKADGPEDDLWAGWGTGPYG